jgi:hypothetical protein
MANRAFVSGVFVLWLGSMAWLLVDKVLPSFFGGEPPMAAGFDPGIPVAWSVKWSGREVGYAASMRTAGLMGTTELHNRVVLDRVPVFDLAPALLKHVVGDIGDLKLDASTRLEFDSLDNFSAFESRVSVNDIPNVVKMTGRVNDAYLELSIRTGSSTYSPKVFIANQSALSEALFPDSKLPYMYVGRKWQEEIYNPFQSPNDPVELVEVEVVGIETIQREGESQRVMRIEYRGEIGPGVQDSARLKAIAWVVPSTGVVLRQDVFIGHSKLRFDRLETEQSQRIGARLFPREISQFNDGQSKTSRVELQDATLSAH